MSLIWCDDPGIGVLNDNLYAILHTVNTDWLKLRPFNGDLKDAFEELVCQLADAEPVENRIQFIRVAAPDAGKEAYCTLSSGEEYGWQAKFFSSMDKSQWKQLDESVETVLKKHPNLTRYYVCTPLDREDPRIDNQQWFMDKWNQWVTKWQTVAEEEGRSIDFIYWGNYELFDRLSRPANAGRRGFWFQETELTDDWFNAQLDSSIYNLGNRYSPEVDFQLPIAKVFHGLVRDSHFISRWTEQFDELKDVVYKAIRRVRDERMSELIQMFSQQVETLFTFEASNRPHRLSWIDITTLQGQLDHLSHSTDQIISRFYELNETERAKKEEAGQPRDQHDNHFGWDIEKFREVNSSLYICSSYVNGPEVQVANTPAVLLTGSAGMGKSHLLADIAEKRREADLPTVLILGQQFTTTDDPWTQILRLLHLNCGRDTFMSMLNAYGESIGSRVLLFIDAINEGQGRFIWEQHIRGFLHDTARYPWVGLVLSVRSSYKRLLTPEDVLKQHNLTKITHQGFRAVEHNAAKRFFAYYGLILLSIPLLHPEFSNPLFLHLFCKGLQKKGLKRIPEGYDGITAIMTFLLEAVDTVLSAKHRYPSTLSLTQKIIDKLAAKLLEAEARSLPFEDAFYWLLNLPQLKAVPESNRGQYIEDLIAEGILSKNYDWQWNKITRQTDGSEILYFNYERFGDHLMVDHLIANCVNKNAPEESFYQDAKLQAFFSDEEVIDKNAGLLEAMAIQLPEKVGIELHQVLPQFADTGSVASAFIESLLWRKQTAYTEESRNYFRWIAESEEEYWFDRLTQNILMITASPGHPFNSDYLHESLMRLTMPERDAWWSTYIHFRYARDTDEPSAVQRLIDWAWSPAAKEDLEGEAVRLLGQTLAWFLTSSHRLLRDSATKALVSLLENRISILIEVLKAFEGVNDPYVCERLWAVAYGCALRTRHTADLKQLSEYDYQTIFDQEEVYPHVLLRDYAREVIEYAVYVGVISNLDMTKVRPPYKSDLPEQFPSNAEIDVKFKFDYKSPDFKPHHWSQNSILSSMTTEYGRGTGAYGDFGRYVFEGQFRGWREDTSADDLSNLAVQWIFERYGYDVERLGEFDRRVNRYKDDRHSVESERIGKKYQWIAMHELLARVSDNFIHRDTWRKEEMPYQGPWEPHVRDIDPSILIRGTNRKKSTTHWWNPPQQFDWTIPHKDWIAIHTDFPDPTTLMQAVDPTTREEWLLLESHHEWREPTLAGEDEDRTSKKNLWYQIRAYIVDEADYERFVVWGKEQDFMGDWMPRVYERYELFSREYYWSPAYQQIMERGERDEDTPAPWRNVNEDYSGVFVGRVIVPVEEYTLSGKQDHSLQDSIIINKPNALIFDKMGLQYTDAEGQLDNAEGQIVCFDPSVEQPSNSCLLVRKRDFMEMLNQQNLRIFWTVLGEKSIYRVHGSGKGYSRTITSGIIHFQGDQPRYDHIIYDETEKYRKQEEERKKQPRAKNTNYTPPLMNWDDE